MKAAILTIILTITSANALECKNDFGAKLSLEVNELNSVTGEIKDLSIKVNLSGKKYPLQRETTISAGLSHFLLKDTDDNEYSLFLKTHVMYSSPSHCRARVCPSYPTKISKTLKVLINGELSDYYTCI